MAMAYATMLASGLTIEEVSETTLADVSVLYKHLRNCIAAGVLTLFPIKERVSRRGSHLHSNPTIVSYHKR